MVKSEYPTTCSEAKIVLLHDEPQRDQAAGDIFADLAQRTGGFVLPFDAGAAARIREVLEAVAVLAVGGTKPLQAKKHSCRRPVAAQSPAAQQLKPSNHDDLSGSET